MFPTIYLDKLISKRPIFESFKDLQSLEVFIESGGAVNEEVDGNMPLQWCYHSYEMSELLLRAGANPNLANSRGMTALMLLVSTDIELSFSPLSTVQQREKNDRHREMLALYLKYDANPHAVDNTGYSVLENAKNYPHLIKELINAGSVPTAQLIVHLLSNTTPSDLLILTMSKLSSEQLKKIIQQTLPSKDNLEVVTSVLEARLLSEQSPTAAKINTFKL